jgi:hypothetical protein
VEGDASYTYICTTNRHQLICDSFQAEISRDARALFVEALVELRSHLWSYVSKLKYLFDILYNSSRLKTRQFRIELAVNDEIRNIASGSALLIDAFDYVNEGKNNVLSFLVKQSTRY